MMQRRSFLMCLFMGAGAAVAASSRPGLALTSLAPPEPATKSTEAAAGSAVAHPEDLEQAKVEKAYWVYRRRWRPRRWYWRRRYYYRRWYRPRYYRRRFYYY